MAANYQQDEEKFLERMSYLRPRFDTALLGYLRYAIENERDKVRSVIEALFCFLFLLGF